FAHSDICRLKGESLLASRIKAHPLDPEMAGMEEPGQESSEADADIETVRRIYAEAEDLFRQAIESARIRQAKSIELRAVISLSSLLQNQGREEEARQMLSEICGWFTEGSDTMDLRRARELLSEPWRRS